MHWRDLTYKVECHLQSAAVLLIGRAQRNGTDLCEVCRGRDPQTERTRQMAYLWREWCSRIEGKATVTESLLMPFLDSQAVGAAGGAPTMAAPIAVVEKTNVLIETSMGLVIVKHRHFATL